MKIKIIKKVNEKRKAAIRSQRWRLRIKLQKDNTILTSNHQYQRKVYNSKSKYDRDKKEQQSVHVLQLASQPNKSWECKDVVFQKMKLYLVVNVILDA